MLILDKERLRLTRLNKANVNLINKQINTKERRSLLKISLLDNVKGLISVNSTQIKSKTLIK